MVRHTIQTARPERPTKQFPQLVARLFVLNHLCPVRTRQGQARAGEFPRLEDRLVAFSTVGYMGERSPNRADALIWALTELFPGLTKAAKRSKPRHRVMPRQSPKAGWANNARRDDALSRSWSLSA